ncbi:hypothetical protein BBJ28_00011897 [Nothophytophthora sp. Chile5]|nr:hypothetical protein BBJ28_00011897 [Nothophytophthora sp. Chile5]
MVDSSSKVANVVSFQSARMKRLFRAFPEVLLVDSTHCTDINGYKQLGFMVHDLFGKHVLVESETKVNMRRAIENFKKNNATWSSVNEIVTDKAMYEKSVLREAFPSAPYVHGKAYLLELLEGDTSVPLYQLFINHWDNMEEEWVAYLRGNVTHPNNNTNNRLESKRYKIKQATKRSGNIDVLISTLILLQEWYEDEYIRQYHRVGLCQPIDEDRELTALAIQLSGANIASVGVVYSQWQCDCIFMQIILLPCRHVMYYRIDKGYETVLPPMICIARRWVVHTPDNDIFRGDVDVGGVGIIAVDDTPVRPAIRRDAKYAQSKAIMEQIVSLLLEQSTPTYRAVYAWHQELCVALRNGELGELEPIALSRPTLLPVDDDSGVAALLPQLPVTPKQAQVGERQANCPSKSQAAVLHDKKKQPKITLDNVDLLLVGPYSFDSVKDAIDQLELPQYEVKGDLHVRTFEVGTSMPVITKMMEEDKLSEAITEVSKQVHATDSRWLTHWDDYGYAALDQLEVMQRVVVTKGFCRCVEHSIEWIDGVEWIESDLTETFRDARWIARVRERLVVAASFDMCNGKITKVVEVVNPTNSHWVAFHIDLQSQVCSMFDPLQMERNYERLEKTVGYVIKPVMRMTTELVYQRVTWCKQQDGNNCGLWCLVVMEQMLSGEAWTGKLYRCAPYLRLRYLFKATQLLTTVTLDDDDDKEEEI